MNATDFDSMFAASDDPWHFRDRWYEARKRAVTLASLPHARYASVYEPGCANGELTAALAPRCDRLLASDGSALAVDIARRRVAGFAHVSVEQQWLPAAWPAAQRFDLIVLGELAYYLDDDALARLTDCVAGSLSPGGVVLACHWRANIAGCAFDGDTVHRRLRTAFRWPSAVSTTDADFCLDVWCDDATSVAQREGLR